MKNEVLADIARMPALRLESVVRGKMHYKIYLDTPAGKKILVVSVSVSDYRAIKNNRSILRRWERGLA